MLHRNAWFIKERVGMFKLTDTYDILDPADQTKLGVAKERPGAIIQTLRMLVSKQLLPTRVDVHEGDDLDSPPLFSIEKGFALFRNRVNVISGTGQVLGWFQQKLLSFGGAFRVFDAEDHEVALVQGDWKGWNFRFVDAQKNEIGRVTKKWAGLGKELFTSADTYAVSIEGEPDPAKAALLLAAGLAVDVIYKERG
jgi:uncharacterized protein YxjI